jgi:hypothetical protein
MTIVASLKVRDGLVLATDSMTQIHQGGQYRTSYANARKLFQARDLPVGVMSYGLGNIGDISIEGLVREFCAELGANVKNVRTITDRLFAFIKAAYDLQFSDLPAEECPVIGFFVAGYGGGGPFAEQSEFVIPRDSKPILVTPSNAFGASWRGIDLPFTRLYKGLDPRLIPHLQAKGLTEREIVELLAQVEVSVIYDGMPVQDAINFAAYIVKTTIGVSSFEIGVPACGGPLQVAAILPSEGFRWIERPDLGVQL